MPTVVRTLSAVMCAAIFGATAARAEDALPKSSPFVPASGPASTASASAETHELAAVSTLGKKTTVNIYDKAAKKGRWIGIGETVDGIKVVNFDAAREQVVVRIGAGPEKTLSLRRASGAGASSAATAATPWAPPPGIASAPVPAAPVAQPAVAPLPAPSPATLTVPPAPGTIAHQEQEARMLVSDLLEIGMAQRKAYEDAQKKAAEAAHANATKPAPPPTAPAKP